MFKNILSTFTAYSSYLELCSMHDDSTYILSHSIHLKWFLPQHNVCIHYVISDYILATGYLTLRIRSTEEERLNLLAVCCSHTLMKLEIQFL